MSSINFTPSPDHPITIKIAINNGENRRFKLALKELGANTLPDKLRSLLAISDTQHVIFERFSDSAGSYITLDSNNPSVYKQLYRAAKAKLKLRIKATITDIPSVKPVDAASEPVTPDRLTSHCYVPPMNHDPLKAEAEQAMKNFGRTETGLTPPMHLLDVSTTAEAQGGADMKLVHVRSVRCPPKSAYLPHSSGPASRVPTAAVAENKEAVKESTMKKETDDEAPLPRFFNAHQHFFAEIQSMSKDCPSALRSPDQALPIPGTPFTICCNNCDAAIPNGHWHCSICDRGDFDLCLNCVENGVLCDLADHWLIKRFVQDGKVINSTTETIAPKKYVRADSAKDIPGAFNSDVKEEESVLDTTRTCNSCVEVFDEINFVTCTVCKDYDLCIPCHVGLKHGHHPSHALVAVSEETKLGMLADKLCAPGRNMRHGAICDGCEMDIYGVRHKCLNCPDWDYCSDCMLDARQTHPGHRFIPVYEPIAVLCRRSQTHFGIHCDGPLCEERGNQYIVGDRYKCAVCHDTDFCANCEALPIKRHNRTHPLIKFKSPVRNVSVTTMGEKENGEHMYTMGDQLPQTSSKSTETTPAAPCANAATQVQTVAEVKPTEPAKEDSKAEAIKPTCASNLQAHFISDAVADGSVLSPSIQFEQVWTLRNPGPHAWPSGCSVHFIGGDIMFNVDPNHPSSVSDIVKATESNATDRMVAVDEEFDFTVIMRTPEREGKAISYWRLKAADGLPFGHKLWCDIDVRVPKAAAPASEVKTEHIEDVTKQVESEEVKKTEKQSESQMIFPKLDKESPVSSTHEAQTASSSFTTAGKEQLLDDVHSTGLEDSTDDGFMTDEEYEMLNASEDEWMEAKNGNN